MNLDVKSFGLSPLYGAQQRFILSPHRNRLMLAGQGAGKSVASMLALLLEAYNPLNRGLALGCFSPTFRQSRRVAQKIMLRMLDDFERIHGFSLVRRFNKSEFILHLRGGAEIWFLSMDKDPDRLRGLEICSAAIDESEALRDPIGTFNLIKGRIRGPGTNRVWISTTPRGLRGVPLLFVRALEDGSADHHIVHAPSYCNPYLGAEILADWKRNMSTRLYRQEVLAELLRPPEAIYPEFSKGIWPRGHIMTSEQYTHKVGDPYHIGVDWGYTSASVLFVAEVEMQGVTVDVVFDELQPDDIPQEHLRSLIAKKIKSLGRDPETFCADRADPRQNRWAMHSFPSSRIITMKTKSEQDVWSGIEIVRSKLDPAVENAPPTLALSADLLATHSDRGIVKSIQGYRRRSVNGVLVDVPTKTDGRDHACDALRYLVKGRHGLQGGWSI
tara:strand:+ start:506 stop:1834 length:1329 start_codon:yes stop_codon:yes gene_type:complete